MSGPVSLSPEALDALLPMHLRFDLGGRVVHLGPGLDRLRAGRALPGVPLLDAFEVLRPAGIDTIAALAIHAGARLRLRFRDGRKVRLKGTLQLLPCGGGLIDMALDLSELPDLGGAPLTNTDFSPTDPTVDMLYLMEANQAAMAESRRLIERLQGAKSQAETQAFTDALTGLSNRRALRRILDRYIGTNEPFSVTQVDLDYFKKVNDTMGHAAGDAVLRAIAGRLRDAVRQTDMVARVGGDEFVIVYRGMTDRDTLERISERIIESVELPVLHNGRECHVSASLGTAISTNYAVPRIDRMMALSDSALYAVKRAGRAGHRIADADPFDETDAA